MKPLLILLCSLCTARGQVLQTHSRSCWAACIETLGGPAQSELVEKVGNRCLTAPQVRVVAGNARGVLLLIPKRTGKHWVVYVRKLTHREGLGVLVWDPDKGYRVLTAAEIRFAVPLTL